MKNIIHIFDCDGVLLNSNFLKISAIEETFLELGFHDEFIKWVSEEFKANFGMTRLKHFQNFQKNSGIFDKKIDDQMLYKAMDIYTDKVFNLYKSSKIIEPTKKYIEALTQKENLYVVSASNQDELRLILPMKYSMLNVENIFGGPVSKNQNVKKISLSNKDKDILIYGDSIKDAEAAISNNIGFVGLTEFATSKDSLIKFCKNNNFVHFKNLSYFKGIHV